MHDNSRGTRFGGESCGAMNLAVPNLVPVWGQGNAKVVQFARRVRRAASFIRKAFRNAAHAACELDETRDALA